MDISIEVQGISKKYRLGRETSGSLRETLSNLVKRSDADSEKEFWALKDVSFEVKEGDCFGIIGKNGSGKSTLLKVLSKITQPTKGTAKMYGRVSSLLEVGTGFHPELTGRENIFLNGSILGMTKREINQKFDEIVDFSGVERFLDTPVKRYSSGMYVRLAFSVAAHLEPEILIIDEVLAVGDADFQKKCLSKMGDAASSGITVLFVSHNMNAVESLCNKAIVLNSGTLSFSGNQKDAITYYLNEQKRLLASQNLTERTDRQGEGRIKLRDCRTVSKTPGEEAIRCGQPMEFVIDLDIVDPSVRDISVSIAISTSRGHQLCDLWSKSSQQELTPTSESMQVRCTIPQLILNKGEFSYNLCVKSGTIVEDWILFAGTFEVESGPFFSGGQVPDPTQGPLLMQQSWQ